MEALPSSRLVVPAAEHADSYRGFVREFVERKETLRNGGNIGYSVRPSARGRGFARELLRLTLERARRLGLAEAWLTCAKTNAASARTMVANGAALVSEEFIESRGEIVQRYRISLAGKDRLS